MSTSPITSALCVIPSRLRVGVPFTLRLKLRGQLRKLDCHNGWNTPKPWVHGPFNYSVQRCIQYLDDCPPEWAGRIEVAGDAALTGPRELVFDGTSQGTLAATNHNYATDRRPIKSFPGFAFSRPGFHFLELIEPSTGLRISSNPAFVTAQEPAHRLYWGDPHWHTIFTDGLRGPEDVFAFARDEAFLDWGAMTDHVEGLTDRMFDYQMAVADDFNAPGPGGFATLCAQEWTSMKFGHRNVYYRGRPSPVMRSTDPRFDTLAKLWGALEGAQALVFPHHSANIVMGVDWSHGWNPRLEKAVEIHSVWGCSECSRDDGNTMPITVLQGEKKGQHVVDALRLGYRMAFVGGGDIHDGRPGDEMHTVQAETGYDQLLPQGFTGLWAPRLARESVYDALQAGQCYATTKRRIYVEAQPDTAGPGITMAVRLASEEGVAIAELLHNGRVATSIKPSADPRIIEGELRLPDLAPGDYCYVRVRTERGHMAWSSPVWK